MELGISNRDRRTLVVGVVAIVGLFATARGVPAAVEWERREVVAATLLRQQLATATLRSTRLNAYRDTLVSRQTTLSGFDSVMLSGASPAAAASALASELDDLADSVGLRITGMQLRADSSATSSLLEVAVRLVGVTDVVGLASFLRAIDGGATPLAVRELAVAQPDPGAAASKAEALRIDVLVAGLARLRRTRDSTDGKQ